MRGTPNQSVEQVCADRYVLYSVHFGFLAPECLMFLPQSQGLREIYKTRNQIIYHPQSGWFEDTPLKGGTEAGCPLKGVEERTSLVRLRSVRGTTTALL